MSSKAYKLTKSKVASGLQCKKKLWFDIHEPAKKIKKATFERGERFNEVIRKHYTKIHGKELNLSGIWDDLIVKTKNAINSKEINVIYEGTFGYLDTQVRTDVLIRKENGWELLEAKSSTKVKDEHITDISIQSFIVRKCLRELGQDLINCKVIHINKDFTLDKSKNYKNLINDENDISKNIVEIEKEIPNYINELLPLAENNTPCPSVSMGTHCTKPYECDYQDRCKSLLPKSNEISYKILPYIGASKDLKSYMKEINSNDLQKVPARFFKNRKNYALNYHGIIQQAHKNNKDWFEPNLKNIFKKFIFPFYFIDFETIMQGVPLIENTQPYEPMPFQWSVHKWESVDKKIDFGKSFLKFTDQDIERQFVKTLLEAVGENGTIFAHSAQGVEIKILNKLKIKKSCQDLAHKIDKMIERVVDSLIISRMNFYSPKMNGDWGIKSIIKAIPDCPLSYDEQNNIGGGDEAQLAWFVYTDKKTNDDERKIQIKNLVDYCEKDTLALYYLIKFLMENSNEQP